MELKIRKIGNGFGVLFPKQLMDEMRVSEGTILHIEKVGEVYEVHSHDAEFAQAMRAFRETEPLHRNSYRELAK